MTTKPIYTITCRNPANGLLTIFDCPKAILAMFFHRSILRSDLSMSLPSLMFLISLRIFITKKPIPTNNAIAKNIFGK